MGCRYSQLIRSHLGWLWLVSAMTAQAQVGIAVGPIGLVYTGDLNQQPQLRSMRAGLHARFQYPLSHTFQLNIHTSMGELKGSEKASPDALGAQRKRTFSRLLTELYPTISFNFIPPVAPKHLFMPEPYLFAGAGLLITQAASTPQKSISPLQPIIPFGIGAKQPLNTGRTLMLALEICFRKTFFDYLDYVDEGQSQNKNFLYGEAYSNDWYHSVNLLLSFSIRGIPCPFPPTDE